MTKDKETHTFTDHWFKEGPHCGHGNYSTRTCTCGYSYKYTQKCDYESSEWHDDGIRSLHYKICKVCGEWNGHTNCANEKGELSCKNPGTCSTCGNVITAGQHFLWFDGQKLYCKWCKEEFATCTNFTPTYNSNHSVCTYKFIFTPKSGHTLKYTANAYNVNPTVKISESSITKSNGIEVTINFTIASTAYNLSVMRIHGGGFWLDGRRTYIDAVTSSSYFNVKADWNKPTISDVQQTPQKEYLGWVTINKVRVTGTEDRSPVVYLSIQDLNDSTNKPATNVAVSVKNGKYDFSFTPLLEGATAGRTYRMFVKDMDGNESYKDFVVKKTDCKPPEIISNTKYDQWSGTKTVTLQIRDYGYGYDNGTGSVKVSLNNESSYKNATLSSKGIYTVIYTFPNETSTLNTYTVYLKDGLENKGSKTIQVGYIDNTKPVISSAPFNVNNNTKTITVNATDARSGISQYGYKHSSANSITWQSGKTMTVSQYGKYTVYVKDKAGNTTSKDVNIGYTITFNVDGGSQTISSQTTDKIKLPNPGSKAGYTFDGWYDGSKKIGGIGDTWTPTANTTVTAKWSIIIYHITYNTYKGSVSGNPATYTVETPTFTLNNPTLAGFTFLGWTSPTSKEAKTAYQISKGSTGDITISANWISGKLSDDSLNTQGGNGSSDSGNLDNTDPDNARSKNTKTQHNNIKLG